MTTKATPKGSYGSFDRALKHLIPSGFQRDQFSAIIVALVLAFLIFILLRQQIVAVFPAISAVAAFAIFILPGAAVSFWLLPGVGNIERLPIALITSVGIMVVPGVLVLTQHLSLNVFVWIFSVIAVIATFALAVIFASRASGTTRVYDYITTNPLLAIALFVLTAGVLFTSLKIPMIGDDWAGMTFIQNFLVTDQLNLYEPFHGSGYPPTSRSEFGVWGLDLALLVRLSGMDPITYYHYLRPIMTLVALIAFYVLAQQVFSHRNAAAFVTALWMIILLATTVWGDPGYDLVARINQDKFSIRYILLPVALFFLLRYLQSHKLRDLFFFGLVGWTSGGMHPIGPVMIGLPCLGFGLFHLALERDKRTFGQLALAALLFGFGMILPIIQLLGVDEDWLAFSLQDATDPSLLIRLGMATRAGRLWLLQNAGYILHPAAIIDPVLLIAVLGIPFLIWQLRRNLSARLLLGTLVFVPLLLYVPLTGKTIGQLVTPWMLYRLLWPVSMAAVLTIGWVLYIGGVRLKKLSAHFGTSSWMQNLILMVVLVVLGGALATSIRRGQAYIEDVNLNPELAQCQGAAPLLEHLPAIILSDSVVLADHDLNFCIPAYSPHAKVLEYRWTSTLSRFPTDRRNEALERVKDMMYFVSARFVDEELASIFARYDVQYILIEEEKSLNTQLRHFDTWFELIAQEGRYLLYRIMEDRPPESLVKANTSLVEGDWETARIIYENLIGQSPNIDLLAHVGMSEVYLSQGEINRAIDELNSSLGVSPLDGVILVQLADTLTAAGRLEEAISVYENAVRQSPRNQDIFQRLGHAYQLTKQSGKARASYKKYVDLLAPAGSARWYRVLGGMYAQAGWNVEAIEAYHRSLAVLPRQVEVEVSIGDIYFNEGDLERAREEYQRAASHDMWATGPVLRFGILDEQEGDLEAAINNYRRAIELGPTNPAGYVLLAAAIRSNDGAESALQAIQDLPGYELILPGPYLASGTIYAGESHYAQALAELELAIERFPLDTSNLKVTLGSVLINSGQNDEAGKLLKDILTADPAIVDVVYILEGRIYTEQAKPEQALGSFYKAVRANPFSANSHLALGDGYVNLAQHEMAIDEYRLAITLQPGLLDGYIALGDVYLAIGDIQHALDMYHQAVTLFPDEATGYVGLAQAYLRQGRSEEAIQTLQDAETTSPESPTIRNSLARVFLAVGEIEEALVQHLQAVEANPTLPAVQRAMGYFSMAHHDTDAAVEAFRKAIKLRPDDGQSRVGLANVLLSLGDFDEALEQLQTAAVSGDWIGKASLVLGDEYRRRANWDQAATAYIKAINAEPTLVNAYIHLGELYKDLGDWDAALAQYQAAAYAEPTSGAALTAYGTALYERGSVTAALESLNQAINVEPTYIEAYSVLSQLLHSVGRSNDALTVIDRLIQIMPGSAAGWLTMANYERKLGQWDEALIADQQAVAIEPGNGSAWISLGNSYQNQGLFLEAEESFLRAIELQTGNIDGYLALGDLYHQSGNIEEAENIYKFAANVDHSLAAAYIKLGEMYQSLGRAEEAEVAFLWAIERAPSHDQGYIGLGRLYEARGDMDQAQVHYEKAIQVAPISVNAHVSLGTLYQIQGRLQGALDVYQKATLIEPRNPIGWIALGDFYRSQGMFQAAEEAYLQIVAAGVEDPAGYLGLGILFQEQGKSDKSLTQFLAAVENFPVSQNAHIALGNWYKTQGEWDLAEKSYQEAIRVRPIEVEGFLALGSLYEDKRDIPAAESLYMQAIEFAPTDNVGYLALGKLKEGQGERDTSEHLYRQAISVAPSDSEGHLRLGALYSAQGNWKQALAEFETAVEIAPTSANAHVSLGNLYLKLSGLSDLWEYFDVYNSLNQSQYYPYINFREWNNKIDYKEKAFVNFKRAIEISPTEMDIIFTLAQAYQLNGDISQAQNMFDKAILYSSSGSDAYIARAEFYSSQGDWEQAQADYESAWRINPQSQVTGLKLANFYSNRGDLIQALLIIDELKQSQIIDAHTQSELGNIYATQGNWTEAINALEEAISYQSNFYDAYIDLARIYELQGELEQALSYSQSATENSPYTPETFIKLGDVQQSRGNYIDAQAAFERVLSLDQTNPTAIMKLDQLNRIIMKSDMDLSVIIEHVNANPTPESFTTLSYLYQLRGEWDVAEYWLYKAISLDPYNFSNWLELGNFHRNSGNWDLALKAFNQALKFEPTSMSSLLALGSIQEQLDMSESALETYQRVVEVDPNRIDGYIALANFQFKLGETEQSLTTILGGISLIPTDYRGYQTLGKLYADMGETASAIEVYQTGLGLMPGAAELYIGIGDIYADNVFEASNALEVAKAFENGAQFRVEKKEEEKRTALTRREIRKSQLTLIHAMEDYVTYQNNLLAAQRIYYQSDSDLELAMENYLKALEFQSNNDAALRGLGKLSLVSKSPEEAVKHFYDAVDANPNSTLSLIFLGFAYLDLDQFYKAIEVFQDLLKFDPNNLYAHLGIAKALSNLEVIDLPQAAASIEHSQFSWDSLINISRREEKERGW